MEDRAELTASAQRNEVIGRIASVARMIQRFSTRVAGASLVVGLITVAALWHWVPGFGAGGFLVGLGLLVVLVAAPVRVIWHGHRITSVYGHPQAIEQALESVPGALDQALVAMQDVIDSGRDARGPLRMIETWLSVRRLQNVWEESPAFDEVQVLVEPVHPDKLNITLAAVWVSLCTLVFGLPVAFASWLAQVVT